MSTTITMPQIYNPLKDYGYTPITTFWEDFTIAEAFGLDAIEDTYQRAFNEWHSNYKMMTELVMVLNNKIWQYHFYNEDKARVHNDLYTTLAAWCEDNFTSDQLDYYYTTTD